MNFTFVYLYVLCIELVLHTNTLYTLMHVFNYITVSKLMLHRMTEKDGENLKLFFPEVNSQRGSEYYIGNQQEE